MAQARLREALNAGSGSQKEKGPPVADGILSVTPDTQEALEWRSKRSIIDSAGTSSSYLEDDTGPKPSELYGKFTWKIENFSEVNKRELRSTIFEVGSYKWYILVYPQGCDVCNHLSLFLCVADYDKLLPGWSHFAQFTIAVVNKDPKKSKYSDTLHRFCKKEHDWGWKKFMELNKVLEGFTVSNTLVIKAQVQVIRDRPSAPFRCLEAQYRRELVRVYLSNVETLARKFVEEKREALLSLRGDPGGFMAFWAGLDAKRRRQMATASGEVILKGVVKRFFNEKEVTSTLVMDALVSGVKQIEESSRLGESKKAKKDKDRQQPLLTVDAERNEWTLRPDLLSVIDRAVTDSLPASRDEGKPLEGLAVRNAQDVEDYSSNYVERDEKRLADLGRRAIEIYAVSHILRELESVHSMEESIKRQDALIKEEEENESLEAARSAARSAAEREKKARKKERQREKKAAEQAKKEAEDEERRQQEALRQAEADEKAAAEASARREEEQQREAERKAALKERADSYKAQEASRLQEAAEAAARAKQEEQAKLERQARPAAEPSVHAGEPSTAEPGKLSRASSSDESLGRPAPIPNGVSQGHDHEDGQSTSTAGDAIASTSTDTSDNEEPARPSPGPSPTDRQASSGPIRGHVEYLQAQLATSNSALAAARAEVGKLQVALSTAQRELSARTREANESTQQLDARAREVNERSQEIAQLHAVIAELRQQVQAYEQQKAAATPSVVTLGDLRGSMSDVDISVSSRPASRSSSVDTCGLDQQQTAQARTAAQAANMKVRTAGTSQSLDSPSDSPHGAHDVGPAAEVGSATSSSVSNFSHRQGHAWPHGEQPGQHSRQPLANGQRGPPGRPCRAAAPVQGNGGPKDSSAALAAASAAAAAALRPHRGGGPGSHAGSSGNGTGQGAAGQQHSQPVPINNGANAKTAAHKMLNGNAAAFHPSSGTPNGRSMAESPTGASMQGPAQPKNGVISYRNAAVGATNGHMAASSPRHRGMGYAQGHQPHAHSPMSQHSHHQPPPPPPGQSPKTTANGPVSAGAMPQPPPQHHHAPKQGQDETSNASGLSRGNSNASSHATTGTALPAESTNGYLGPMMYPAASGMQAGAQQPQPASSYTPLPDKKKDRDAPPQESPGLDDFAHMGMITNLLE